MTDHLIDAEALAPVLAEHLPKQRWFGGDAAAAAALEVEEVNVLRPAWPGLVQAVVAVPDHGGRARYQVVLGLREADSPEAFLEGRADAVAGMVSSSAGPALAYDATVDSELALSLLEHTAPSEHAERARPLGADQSNTSIVYDERLFLKLFRRLGDGPNPDVEVPRALAERGFSHVARPLGEWRSKGRDLAVVVEFLSGGVDGFQLALTSIRDLYGARVDPADAGGDFGPDAQRLGAITAQMHVVLADAFGVVPADTDQWAADMDGQLERTDLAAVDPSGAADPTRVAAVYERLRQVAGGPAIRIHGDYHLGQVVRSDAGWHVLDFEGEPARPLEERRRPSSALRDVAGMFRSFHYAPEVVLREYGDEVDEELQALARAWEQRAREQFLAGYLEVEGVDAVLPPSPVARDVVLAAFELDKAVYEVDYEASHRPEWVGIPLSAVRRILEETARDERIP